MASSGFNKVKELFYIKPKDDDDEKSIVAKVAGKRRESLGKSEGIEEESSDRKRLEPVQKNINKFRKSLKALLITVGLFSALFAVIGKNLKDYMEQNVAHSASLIEYKALEMYIDELEPMSEHSVDSYLRKIALILKTAMAVAEKEGTTIEESLPKKITMEILAERAEKLVPLLLRGDEVENMQRVHTEVQKQYTIEPQLLIDLVDNLIDKLNLPENIGPTPEERNLRFEHAMYVIIDEWKKENNDAENLVAFSDYPFFPLFCRNFASFCNASAEPEKAVAEVLSQQVFDQFTSEEKDKMSQSVMGLLDIPHFVDEGRNNDNIVVSR